MYPARPTGVVRTARLLAAGAPPAKVPATSQHWMTGLQRQVGNQVLARQLATLTGPLGTKQVADALQWYRQQPQLYPKQVINDIRAKLGISAGGIDAELTQAVARFQQANAAKPGLDVDGKAGPRSTPRLFPSGLAAAGEGKKFAADADKAFAKWNTLTTAQSRADELVKTVNVRLAAANVPPLTAVLNPKASPNEQGSFDFEKWTMKLNPFLLNRPGLDQPAAAKLADTVFHEARHAEQWFAIARLLAGRKKTPAQIHAQTAIEATVCGKAGAHKILPGTTEAVGATGWFESVYGKDQAKREAVLRQVEAADIALTVERCRLLRHPSPRAAALFAKAKADFEIKLAAYKNLPEENDAFATTDTAGVAAAITKGTPNAAPVPKEDPCDQLTRLKIPLPGPA
jgi:hypothetical protein